MMPKQHEPIPEEFANHWQNLLDTIEQILEVPVALVMRVHEREIEVFSRSSGKKNLYVQGERASLNTGLYCETVMRTQGELLVPNALKDPEWDHNPDLELGYINYLGYPLLWPGGEAFGTICVLDSVEHAYSDVQRKLLQQYAASVEKDLAALAQRRYDKATAPIYELMVDNAADAFLFHDLDGNIHHVNRKACELFGYTQAEFLTMKPWDLTAEEYRSLRESRVKTIVEKREYTFRTIMPHRDGTRIPLELSATLVEHDGGPSIFSIARPLASRMLPEEELLESERNLREAQRIAHVGNWTYDLQTEALDVTDEIYRIFGYQPGETIEADSLLSRHVHPSDRARAEREITERLEQRFAFRSEVRIDAADGAERYIYVRGEPVLGSDGTAHSFTGIVADISERILREKEIEESHKRYRALVEDLGDNHLVFRYSYPDGILEYVSPGAKAIFDFDHEEAIGKIFYELIQWTPETIALFSELLPKLQPGNRIHEVEQSFFHPDGTKRYIRVTANAIGNEEDGVVCVDGIARDVTDEKRRQAEHEESLVRFRDMIEDLGDDYVVYRYTPDMKMVYASPGSESVFGIRPEDGYGRTYLDLVDWTDETLQEDEANTAQLLETGHFHGTELAFRHPDGSLRHITTSEHLVYDADGEVEFIDGIAVDVTERKRIELALKESEERFDLAIAATSDGIWDLYIPTMQIYYSPRWKEMLGYADDELENNFETWQSNIHPDDLQNALDTTTTNLQGSVDRFVLEVRLRHKDGGYLDILSRIKIVRDEHGQPIRMVGTNQDISEQRQLETKLRESEAGLKEAQRVAHIGSWDITVPSMKMQVSEESIRLFGYEPGEKEVTFEIYLEHIHPEDRDMVLAAQNPANGIQEMIDYRILRKDGEVRHLRSLRKFVFHESGELARLHGTIQDITENKLAEQALRWSEEQLRDAQRIAHIGSWAVDLPYFRSTWSDESFRIFGYEPGEIEPTGEFYLAHIHPDDRAFVTDVLDLTTPLVSEMEYRIIRKDGEVRYLHSNAEFVFNDDGELIRLFGTMQDVTAQKLTELALKESEERFTLAIDATEDGLWDYNGLTHEVYFSPRWKTMLGYNVDELEDTFETWVGLMHPDDRTAMLETIRNLTDDGADRFENEHRLRHKDGTYRNIFTRGTNVKDADGRVIRTLGTNQDITDHRKLEVQLRQSEHELRDAQRIAHIGSWAVDLATYTTTWSDEAYRIVGLEPGSVEPTQEFFLSFVHPEDLPLVTDVLDLSTELVTDMVFRIVRTDGEVRYCKSNGEYVYNADGELIRLFGTMQDITEQTMLRIALEQSEQRFELAIKATADGIWDLDLRNNIAYYSPRWKEMLGYADDELANEYGLWHTLVHPDEVQRVNERFAQILAGTDAQFVLDARLRHKDGAYRNIRSRGVIVRNEDGQAIRMAGTHTDLTKEMQLEDHLRLFKNLADESGQGFGIATMDRKIIYMNKTLLELRGAVSAEAYVGKDFTQFYKGEMGDKLQGEILPAVLAGGKWMGEMYAISPDGVRHSTFQNFFIIRNDNGEPQYFASIITPIDELKKKEEELQIFRQFADESGQGIAMGTLDGRAVYTNRTLRELIEVEEGGNFPSDYQAMVRINGEEKSVKDFILPILLKQGQWTGETTQITVSGKTIHTIESFFLLGDEDGNPLYIGDVITPIDHLKEKEAQLREARRAAEAASEAKSQFLANMSHEIRTPLNAIVGMSHLALNTDVTPKQRHYLTNIDQAGRSLRDVIGGVLDFSKIEAGKLELYNESFQVESTLRQIMELIVIDAAEKNLEIHTELDLDIPAYVVGDGVRLAQVLNNLLHNAVKFTEEGEVRLRARLIRREEQRAYLEFVVSDTGIGMTETQMENLFEVFTQGDGSITRKYGGSGLGLAISKRLVELMGGSIRVESAVMQGTSFTVQVPFDIDAGQQGELKALNTGTTFFVDMPFGIDPAHSAETLRSHIPDSVKGKRVLLIDDSQTARCVEMELLTNAGMQVTALQSGIEALQYLSQSAGNLAAYDVIIVDLEMEKLNGLEFAKRLNARGETTPPLLLMTTVYWRNQIQARATEAGFTGLVMKPVFPTELGTMLARALSGETPGIPQRADASQRDDAAQRADAAQLEGDTQHLNGKILLVEDNKINQEVVTELLKNLGLNVIVATDGVEAITYMRKHEFDLVLMDVQMPKMDGLTATRYIRQMDVECAASIPILALTAHALDGDREKCLAAGMNDYIPKPVDPELLSSLLRKWMVQSTPLPADKTTNKVMLEGETWIKKLEEHGIDAIHSLRQLGGNTEFYIRMLRHFTDEYQFIPARIAQCIADGDYEQARDEAHSLKNVAGYIGAKSMWNALVDLNTELKQGSPTLELSLDTFTNEMTALVAVINNALRLMKTEAN